MMDYEELLERYYDIALRYIEHYYLGIDSFVWGSRLGELYLLLEGHVGVLPEDIYDKAVRLSGALRDFKDHFRETYGEDWS